VTVEAFKSINLLMLMLLLQLNIIAIILIYTLVDSILLIYIIKHIIKYCFQPHFIILKIISQFGHQLSNANKRDQKLAGLGEEILLVILGSVKSVEKWGTTFVRA
jgi:hypothetical protein